MCGITGIVNTDGCPIEREILENMTGALAHRGPDDEGIFIARNSKIHVGFGHRRLSIIDLSKSAHQPMCNEDETIWLTYNGEIYNFRELRKDLAAKGHVFSSDSDTEVIIHGYEEYGEDLFNKLNGMFAFGLWDSQRQVLYLVRDRYGQKPLYYWHSPKGIAFASELKSLTHHPDLDKVIDLHSLSRYLLYEYVPAPHSIFKGVKKVLPGHFLKWQDAVAHTIPYWKIGFNGTATNRALPIPEVKNKLIDLLKLSVERRLVSDVPLGVFLSGGIDSSSIVALMAELVPPAQIKTFSIGFRERSFDESSYAREVARQFGTDHHEQILTPGKMIDILPEVWDLLDEPFADASIIPTYLLSKFTQQFVTVALGGDGGDELFAGYDPFVAHIAARHYEKIPGFIQNSIFRPLVQRMPVSMKNMSFDFKLKQFLKGISYETGVRNQVWLGSFSKEEQKDLFAPDIRRLLNGFDPYGDMHQACREMEFRDPLDEIIFLYSRFYLQDDILAKVDRASMATSLEVRSPYLDVQFAEFANNLPSRLKLKGLNRKYILKQALEKKLPREILYRKKKGFGIPLAKWFKVELKTTLLDIFSYHRLKREGLFNVDGVQKLLEDHFSGARDNRKQIWTLFVFQIWKERFA